MNNNDWWNDFSNNLASDLAPLVALFGENPTKQYLSECLTLKDIIIFATGPLGIITTVVSAIRVCGSPSLRAFIGKAQEGGGTSEAELCSSTSRDVCELYNNGGIARVFGRPKILEAVHDTNACAEDFHGDDTTAGIRSFEERLTTQKGKEEWIEQTRERRVLCGLELEPGETLPEKRFAQNPNLSLNIGIKRRSKYVFLAAAISGILLQSLVLVWAGLTRYYFQWTRGGKEDVYAIYLTTIGTALMFRSSSLCQSDRA